MTNLFSHFLTLFWANPLAQTLGLIATVIVAISFSCTDDRRFRTMMIVGQCIFIVHFILLGAFAGALSFGLAASRTIWSTFISRDRSVYGIFLCLYLLAGYFRVDVWYDVLPLLGGVIAMTGLFFATGIRERYFFVIAPAIILAYNIYVGSIGGIINESLVIIINLITIIRMIRARDRQISLK